MGRLNPRREIKIQGANREVSERKTDSDHGLFSSESIRSGERARFVGIFQGCIGLWTARCWLARRLHQFKTSTTMDNGVNFPHLCIKCVALKNFSLLIKTDWRVICPFVAENAGRGQAITIRVDRGWSRYGVSKEI